MPAPTAYRLIQPDALSARTWPLPAARARRLIRA